MARVLSDQAPADCPLCCLESCAGTVEVAAVLSTRMAAASQARRLVSLSWSAECIHVQRDGLADDQSEIERGVVVVDDDDDERLLCMLA